MSDYITLNVEVSCGICGTKRLVSIACMEPMVNDYFECMVAKYPYYDYRCQECETVYGIQEHILEGGE